MWRVPPLLGALQVDHLQLRRLAFFLLVVALLIPMLVTYYMDDLPDLFSWLGAPGRAGGDSGGRVALSKRLAYKVDVWFSTNSWVKSAALLVATLVPVSGAQSLPDLKHSNCSNLHDVLLPFVPPRC